MTIDKEKLKVLAEVAIQPGAHYLTRSLRITDLANAVSPEAILALLAEIERGNRLFAATCLALGSVGEALGIPGEEQEGGACELIEAIDQLKADNETLRKIISDAATACGASVSVECTPEFMANLPAEISMVVGSLRKQVEDLSPFKGYVPKDFRASNKCLACGEYHHGLGNLPCPKCTPVAQYKERGQ